VNVTDVLELLRRWAVAWLVLLTVGCKIPTEYTVRSPECPWPPPRASDTTVTSVPLGCPWRDEAGEIVPGWPRL
jgi:hypothetical protein